MCSPQARERVSLYCRLSHELYSSSGLNTSGCSVGSSCLNQSRGAMPNITVVRSQLFEAIGKSYTDAEFDELCFEFGVEVDDVEPQVIEFTVDGETIKEEHVVYVIAIPANRYDLLCLEGFARALRIFIGKEAFPVRFLVISPCSAMSHRG